MSLVKVKEYLKRYNADELELNRQDDAETNGDANALDGQEQAKMMADSNGQELADPNSEVDVDLKIRLSSIKKLNSTSALTGQLDYDTDNPLGIPARLDVNQTINPYYKYESLEQIKEVLDKTKYLELTKTYRSSKEIIEYTNKILNLTFVSAIRKDNNKPVLFRKETNLKKQLLNDINYLKNE